MTTTALVTGASSGIGRELARLFAAQGIPLVLVARRREQLESLAEELKREHGISAQVFVSDLAEPSAPQSVHSFCKAAGISIGYLVNNAGLGDHGPFAASDVQKQQQMIQVNIGALTILTRLFLPDMLAAGKGRILNVASMAAFLPGPGMSVYYASKAYVLHFSEALSAETAGTGVTVTALCPGPTESEFYDVAGMQGVRLFKMRKVPTALQVARSGFRAMMHGRRLLVYDRLNALMTVFISCSPRSWVLRISRLINARTT